MQSENISLEATLSNENIDLNYVLFHPEFYGSLRKARPHFMRYIIRNFDRILESLFEERHKDRKEILPHLAILESPEPNVKRYLIEKTRFVPYILDYPRTIKIYNPPSVELFFNSLPSFILDQNNELLPYFAQKDFFESIIQNCDIQEAYVFMRNAIGSASQSFQMFFEKIGISDICSKYMNGKSVLNLNVQRLFMVVVQKYSRQAALSLINNDVLSTLIDTAFRERSYHIVDFVNYMYEKSQKVDSLSQWYAIQFIVDDRIPDFCDVIIRSQVFDALIKSTANILITYLKTHQKTFPKIDMVAEKLIGDIFVFPTNSFLHNISVRFIQAYSSFDDVFGEIIEKSNFCEKTLNAYKTRDTNIQCCYWGALRIICKLIKEPSGVSLSDWKKYVTKRNDKIENIFKEKPAPVTSKIVETTPTGKRVWHINIFDVAKVLMLVLAVLLVYLNRR